MKNTILGMKRILALLAVGCGLCHWLPVMAQENTDTVAAAVSAPATDATLSNASPALLEDTSEPGKWKAEIDRQAVVVFGKNAELKTNESADAVVVIGGSAKVSGKVREAVVVIGGDAEIDGEVGEAVVAILGNVKINPGAVVREEVVAVGGKIEVANGAHVHGQTQEVDLAGLRLGQDPAPARLQLGEAVLEAPFNLAGGRAHRLGDIAVVFEAGEAFIVGRPHAAASDEAASGDGQITAPMPGRIVAVAVRAGDEVVRGAPLVTLEAMKMEHALVAPFDARVAEVRCSAGEQTTEGALLVRLEALA